MGDWGFGSNEETFRALVAAYAQKHRHYHTAEHIDACLVHFDRCVSQMDNPREVELALWFHDAVYCPYAGDSELKSARCAVSFLLGNGAGADVVDRVKRLIMATEHALPPQSKDESILVDIDLSVLGSDSKTYEVFENAVRKEYRFVPGFLYNRKRAAVLQGFLRRACIYGNEPFIAEREERARANLSGVVSDLLRRN